MEETQIKINLDHHFNLALWCLWSVGIFAIAHEDYV